MYRSQADSLARHNHSFGMHLCVPLEEVLDQTGFEFYHANHPAVTSTPTEAELAELSGPVKQALSPVYPDFCQKAFTP